MPLPVSNDPVTDQGRLYVSPSLPAGDGGLPIAPVADPDAAVMANMPTDGNANVPNVATRVINKLLGTGGEERYKTWPEKLLRDALSAPHDVLNSTVPSTSGDLIKPALDMSALAGTGGLGGVGEGGAAALGSSPFLRPALKYEGKIYKAPMGGEHMDAIPETLRPEFTKQAMSGEDISNFNFGFMNHKGQFLDREKALKYAIDEGLLSPHDAKYGALTSTLMADSSKEAAAIDILKSHLSDEVPLKPGTAKIPEGSIRLYHQTSTDAMKDIAENGIDINKAKGIEGPRAIYADEKGFYGKPGEVPTVEFHVPKERWDSPFVRADSKLDNGKVSPENIIGIHLPWHSKANYIMEHPKVKENVLSGQHDDLLSDKDYGKAIAYIKSKYEE